MTITRRFKFICAIALVPAVFLLAFGMGSMAWFHFAKPERTCVSCHEMADVHTAWLGSSHRTFHCRECHGGSLTLDMHALRSHVNRVVQHFRRSPDKNIRLSENMVLGLQEACRECHPQSFADWQSSRHSATYAQIFLDKKHNQTEQLAPDCLRCHGMFFNGHIEDLVTPVSTTGPWALKDSSKTNQPAIPCLACHQVHTTAAGVQAAHLYVRREQASFSTDQLPITPIYQGERAVKLSPDPHQRLCTQCHAPNAFRQLGTADDRTPSGVHEGLSCLDCHATHSVSAKTSCGACHPAKSHCGLDVKKMDTTYLSADSKHNIHFVTCGDCHNGQRPTGKK
jgi:hypothetical protein